VHGQRDYDAEQADAAGKQSLDSGTGSRKASASQRSTVSAPRYAKRRKLSQAKADRRSTRQAARWQVDLDSDTEEERENEKGQLDTLADANNQRENQGVNYSNSNNGSGPLANSTVTDDDNDDDDIGADSIQPLDGENDLDNEVGKLKDCTCAISDAANDVHNDSNANSDIDSGRETDGGSDADGDGDTNTNLTGRECQVGLHFRPRRQTSNETAGTADMVGASSWPAARIREKANALARPSFHSASNRIKQAHGGGARDSETTLSAPSSLIRVRYRCMHIDANGNGCGKFVSSACLSCRCARHCIETQRARVARGDNAFTLCGAQKHRVSV
jgi:hypothetical protein